MADEVQNLSIKIKINADTQQLEVVDAKLKKFNTSINDTSKKAGATAGGLNDMEKGLNSLTAPLGVDLAAFAGVAGAIGLVGGTIVAGISKWEEEKKLNREVAAVVNGLGLNYDSLRGSIESNLESLKSNTQFTDEQVKKSFTQALKYTGDVTQSYKLLQIAQNVSVGTGKSLEEVMGTLGSAMKGGSRATKILFTEFGKLGTQGKDVNEMINNLGNSFPNTAKNEESLAKTTTELKEAFEDSSGAIGEQLSPSLVELGETIKPVVVGITSFVNLLVNSFMLNIDIMRTGVRVIKDIVTLNFKDIGKAGDEFVKKEQKRFEDYGTSIIKANEIMNNGKKKSDTNYGKFKAKTLTDEVGDEQKNGQIKADLARKLDKIQQENAKNSYTERMQLLDADVAKYKKAGADEKDITTFYESEKTRITLDEETRKGKAKKELEGIQADAAKTSTLQEIDLLNETYNSDLENYKNQLANKELTQQEYNQIRLARENKLATNITAVWQKEFEAQIGILSGFMGSLTSAFGEASAVGKTAAIAQATMDTYAAANKALATYPPPFSFIAMGTAIVSGLANVAKISSVPMMAEGGISNGATPVVFGERGREAIIPLNSPQGKSLLGGGGGGVTISNIQIQFPGVTSFQDWLKADPKLIKEVVEKKMLQAFSQLSKEGKMTSVSKVNNI